MVDLAKVWAQRVSKIVTGISCDDSGFHTAVVSKDAHIYMFNKKGQIDWYKKLEMASTAVDVAPDASFVVVGSNYNVTCYDIKGNVKWNQKVGGEVKKLQISSNSRKIGVASADCQMYMFNDTGVLLWRYQTEGQATAAGVNHDGSINIVGSTNGDVHVVDGLGALITRMDFPFDILSLTNSGIGTKVLIGSYAHMSYVDLEEGSKQTFEIENWVKDCAINHAGDMILVGSMGIVSFFDSNFKNIYNLSPNGWAHAVHITTTGKYIAVGYGDDHVDLYENRDATEQKAPAADDFQVTKEMWDLLVARVAALEKASAPYQLEPTE